MSGRTIESWKLLADLGERNVTMKDLHMSINCNKKGHAA